MKKIFGSLIAIILLASLVIATVDGVTIRTDKTLYQIGEPVTFTLYNNNSTTFEIDNKTSIVNSTGICVWHCYQIALYIPLIVPPGANSSFVTWDQKGENGRVSPGFYKGRLGDYYSNEFEIINNVTNVTSGDILAHYRGLGQNPNIVETSDLLHAADDWRMNMIPPGFSASLTTSQLLTLADEWRNAPSPSFTNITISNFSFQPQTINVANGTSITWTNKDTTNHTVTSDTGIFDSGNITQDDTYSFMFNTTGNYSYHCKNHIFMTGEVIVS